MAKRGKLVKVWKGPRPGDYVLMHREDAVAAGLLPVTPKRRLAATDKQRRPQEDKAPAEPLAEDDLTEIAGVGPATAAALRALGIVTFAQLRRADPVVLGSLAPGARSAIEGWIDG